MIITRLIGGLGNQLFQYALGRNLAEKRKTKLKLDISGFEIYKLHQYGLSHFNIKEEIASDSDLAALGILKSRALLSKIRRILEKARLYRNPAHIIERGLQFNSLILDLPDNVYLDGYWQSEKYFKFIDNIIRKEITLRESLDFEGQKFARAIQSSQSISIHIRRADYADNLKTRLVHGLLNLDYYYQAARQIAQKVAAPRFFIFSDDIGWVKDNFRVNYPVIFVDKNGPEKNYEDLRLMSLCKHNIIANSSFSWWGAWLNNNPNKIVIAPKRWLNLASRNAEYSLPETWLKL